MQETDSSKVIASEAKLQRRLKISGAANVVLAAIVVFLLIVVLAEGREPGVDASNTDQTQSAEVAPAATGGATTHVRNDPDDYMAIGDINAPVVLSEWTDLRCPYCAVFANQTMPKIIQDYVDKGLVRVEFNDVAFFGDESLNGAVAARAAGKQGLYMPYIEELYSRAPESGHASLPEDVLLDIAQTVGVSDMDQFKADLASPELSAQVLESQRNAQAWGISSVPFFVVGPDNQMLSGAQPYEAFQQVLDSQVGN